MTFNAWAIHSRSEEGHGLIGKYWWFDNKAPEVPDQFDGYKVVLFRTRSIAKKHLLSVKYSFPKARVLPVEITIKEKKNEA